MNNSLIQRKPLTKKIILQELTKIRIDHSISISTDDLDKKINLLFEICKDLSVDDFIRATNQILTETADFYGKFPTAATFIEKSGYKTAKFDYLVKEINFVAKYTCLLKLTFSDSNKAVFHFNKKEGFDIFQKLDEKVRQKIKDKVAQEMGAIGFEVKY